MPDRKYIKHRGNLYVLAADLPGTRTLWEKGKEVEKEDRETSEKVKRSEQKATRSVEMQVKELRTKFSDTYAAVQKAEKNMDSLESFIKESSKSRFVKKLSKFTKTDKGLDMSTALTSLQESMVRPGHDILKRIRKMLDKISAEHPDAYQEGPSDKFFTDMISTR